MSRILAIDYGMKRTGIAITDTSRIIATALETVPSDKLLQFLEAYFKKEPVGELVLGLPVRLDNSDTDMTQPVRNLAKVLQERFPEKKLSFVDERFTSSLARHAMIAGGMKKKDRRDKANVDMISATIILQSFLDQRG